VCRRFFIVQSSSPHSGASDSHNAWLNSRGPGHHPEHLEQRNQAAFARYSDALFTGPELQKAHPDTIVVQAFPAHGLYRSYVPQAFSTGRQGQVELWMVQPDGSVRSRT